MIRFARLLIFLILSLSAAPVLAQAPAPAAPAATAATGPQRTARIEAELVAMSAWAAPGSTVIVGVRQDIEPGWHTYWRNPGDSGGATTLAWTLPEGVTAGDIVWPVPERQRLLDLMNFGYSGVVYLPVPVQIPATARPGTSLRLTAKALFLVCSAEMCVPDELTLSLNLPVREGAAPLVRGHGAAIAVVLEQSPRPAAIEARATLVDGVVTLTATGGPLVGKDPGPSYFFPFEGGVIDHAAPQTGAWGPDGLTLRLPAGGDVRAGGLTGPIGGVLATTLGAFEITARPGPALSGATGTGALAAAPEDRSADAGEAGGLATFVQAALFALLGGLILNLMPCVFPVLAIKVVGFVNEKSRAARLTSGLAYTAGVVLSFLALGALLLSLRAAGEQLGWGFQLQSPAVVAGLAALFTLLGLNLAGLFDFGSILPGRVVNLQAKNPSLNAFLSGVMATAIASPCTAPFMGASLGYAVGLPALQALAVFGAIGIGMALPYLAASAVPAVARLLPRPGAWMVTFKQLMAFPMFATVAWLVWVLGQQSGIDGAGALLALLVLLALAVWSFSLRGTARRSIATFSVALCALGIWAIGPNIVKPAVTPVAAASARWQDWQPGRVEQLTAQGQSVFVDFTAAWCVTCQYNKKTTLTDAGVLADMDAKNVALLRADWTRRDPAVTKALAELGRSGVPVYVFYKPGRAPVVLSEILSVSDVRAELARL